MPSVHSILFFFPKTNSACRRNKEANQYKFHPFRQRCPFLAVRPSSSYLRFISSLGRLVERVWRERILLCSEECSSSFKVPASSLQTLDRYFALQVRGRANLDNHCLLLWRRHVCSGECGWNGYLGWSLRDPGGETAGGTKA